MTNWIKPKWEDELDEFQRVEGETGINIPNLKLCFDHGRAMTLTDDVWAKLENTESYTVEDIQEVSDLLDTYGKNGIRILVGFTLGSAMPMPIIMQRGSGYELVAGNSRLCIAKVWGVDPTVWVMQVPDTMQEGIYGASYTDM